jgi:hypothetical protein
MKSKIILVLLMLVFFSVSTFARVEVGAPLDGGLLSILGAAGVAYFVARRKKKKLDQ